MVLNVLIKKIKTRIYATPAVEGLILFVENYYLTLLYHIIVIIISQIAPASDPNPLLISYSIAV